MGRPYANEMAQLPTTYAWALEADVDEFSDGIRDAATRPLIVVGSGGSLTAAHLAADFHQRGLGQVARVMTPYELVAFGGPPRGSAVLMFSAGGRNKDIRGALDVCLATEPDVLILVTGAQDSPAARTARAARFPRVAAYEIPSGRDGFLATNSLLAFAVLTSRAYAAIGAASELPAWPLLVGDGPLDGIAERDGTTPLAGSTKLFGRAVAARTNSAASSVPRTLVVLHGVDTRAAAVDLESKCTEAALANVQLADYRNFAHGRHHWLAKHDATVVTLESPADVRLVERTLAQLPAFQSIARLRTTHENAAGSLEALVRVMHLAGSLGDEMDIDPGRPGVPDFGGKLYSLPVIRLAAPSDPDLLPEAERVAITRKSGCSTRLLARNGTLNMWRAGYAAAREALEQATYGGVVFDYDGTLVDRADRFGGPRPEVARALETILLAHVPVGIATGRGRSAGEALRAQLPRHLWDGVLIGYYNGGDVAPLSDSDAPYGMSDVAEALQPALAALSKHALLNAMAVITPRRPQITVQPRAPQFADDVWRLVASVLVGDAGRSVRVVRSSHSIDVLQPDVSKLRLVEALRESFGVSRAVAILSVGDRGQWPGNDAEMLASLVAVTVDEASADMAHAWHWAPTGTRGVEATLALCARFAYDPPFVASGARSTFRVMPVSHEVPGGSAAAVRASDGTAGPPPLPQRALRRGAT